MSVANFDIATGDIDIILVVEFSSQNKLLYNLYWLESGKVTSYYILLWHSYDVQA